MRLLTSTIGQKIIVGITGLVMAGFLLGHMAGNLLIFVSPQAYNSYGHAIISNKPLLYGTELVLLVSVIAHILVIIALTRKNREAKPQAYEVTAAGHKKTSLMSKSMIFNGPILAIFIISHLNSFKFGKHYEVEYEGVVMRDLHRLMVEKFNDPVYVVGYLICLLLLGAHLRHGITSVFSTLGLMNEKIRPTIERVGWIYAVVVAGGFMTQPIYLLLRAM